MKIHFDRISSTKLLGGLLEEEIAELLDSEKSKIKEYSKGQVIYLEKEDCQFIDIVLKGQVSVQKIDEDGNVMLISTINRGEAIGVNLIFSARNCYPFNVMTASQTTLLHLGKESILELCNRNQIFMTHLLESISDRALALTDKINSIAMKTLRQKILDFLESEKIKQNKDIIRLPMTKKEIAEKFGVQRTSLSRELNKMRKENLIITLKR